MSAPALATRKHSAPLAVSAPDPEPAPLPSEPQPPEEPIIADPLPPAPVPDPPISVGERARLLAA